MGCPSMGRQGILGRGEGSFLSRWDVCFYFVPRSPKSSVWGWQEAMGERWVGRANEACSSAVRSCATQRKQEAGSPWAKLGKL